MSIEPISMSGGHVWKSCVEEPDIYIVGNYSTEHQMTKKKTNDFLHPGTLQEARQGYTVYSFHKLHIKENIKQQAF